MWRATLAGVLLTALAVGGALVLAGTQAGTRWLLARAQAAGLEVGRASGTVLGGLHLTGVRWQSATATVTVNTLRWHPRPGALARGRLDLGTVQAGGVAVALRTTPDAPAEPFAWPRLRVPLPVHLRALTVHDVSIQRDDAPLLHHGDLRASATLRASRLELAVDTLRADALQVRGKVHIAFDAHGALSGALAWEYTVAERRWAGDLDLRGALAETVSLRHELTAPAPATLSAQIATPLKPGDWSAELVLPDTALAVFGAPQPWHGHATVHASGRGPGGSLRGDFALTGTPAGPLTGQLRLDGANTVWAIEALHLEGPEDARLDLTGEVDLAATPSGRVQARWQALRWPVSGPAGVHARAGELTLEGTADAWQFGLETAIEGQYGGPGRVRAHGTGTAQALRVENLDAQMLDGTLTGTARVTFAGAPAWEYDLTARGLNPGRVHPDWPGAVSAAVHGSGQMQDAGITQHVTLAALGGQLRGHALAGSGAVTQTGPLVAAQRLDLRMGSAHLALDGTLTDGLRLRASIPELADLVPGAAGAVRADLTVSGTPPALGVRGTVSATALAYADWRVGTLGATVDLARDATDRLMVDVRAQDLAGPLALDTLRVHAGPRASAHTLTVEAQAPDWQASVQARGGVGADQTWRGALHGARLRAADAGTWTLADPAALSVGAHAQSLAQACLASAGARVCASGTNTAGSYAAKAELTALPLAALAALLPPDLQTEGTLAGTAAVRGTPGEPPHGELALNAAAGTWRLHRAGQEPLEFAHGGIELDARFDAAATALSARVAHVTGGPAMLDARLRGPALAALAQADAPLAGQVTVRDLSVVPLQVLSADLADLSGMINADVALSGQRAAPRLRGRADLQDARVTLPRLGTELRDIRLSVLAQADQVLRIDGQARSGKGTLGVGGTVVLDPARGWPLDLDITGQDFVASDTRAARVLVSPALSVRAAGQRITVRGDIGVPEALLRPTGTTQAASTSPDVVVTGRADVPPPSPWTVDAELTVRLGDKVRLAYAGLAAPLAAGVRVPGYALDARLGGQLTVRDRPGEITRASGAINIEEGQFSAYGQRLDITSGRLRFADQALDNPGVSLDAQRKVGEVTAGVRVRGRLQKPTLTVFSDPAMAQEEALSYLILGRPLRGASAEEGSMLARAAGALGVSGGDRLAKRIGARLGLDELGVSGGENGSGVQGAALQAGKYLSPRLYVGYGLGLFDQVGAFKVRFDLTERWVLEATSGLGQAVDLLYARER